MSANGQNRRLRAAFLVLLAILPALLTGSCATRGPGTVVIRTFGDISSFSPLLAGDGASLQAQALLWPPPLDIDRLTGEALPSLTTWELSDDGLVYRFTIRDDAYWSDGAPISSADMKFVIDAIRLPEVASPLESALASVAAVEIIDERSYDIVLEDVDCSALGRLGRLRFLPSHRYAADFSDVATSAFNDMPDISGGPYILESHAPGDHQVYVANRSFFGGAPQIPRLVNRVIAGHAEALLAIQAGEIDYSYFHGDLFARIERREHLQWNVFPQLSVYFLALNRVARDSSSPAWDRDGISPGQAPHPLFSDLRVRKAVAMGYNKEDILAMPAGTPLVGAVSPAIAWAYNSDIQPWPFDPEAAMALLDEAGWLDSDGDGVRDRDGVPLSFTISYSDILPLFETTALVVQDQLRDIGFDVALEKLAWRDYLRDVYLGRQFDATPMSNSAGAGGPPDPNDFMTLLESREDRPGSGKGIASYVNPGIDALIDAGRSLPGCGIEERAKIYREIQRLAHEDLAYDWTVVPNIWHTAHRRIRNFRPGPSWVFHGYTSQVHEWALEG
ncbi:MAG: ABC transporter substrate-binding protein [Anaerolineaceae bacterium]|nr:ABC transporter substrate-binding protein [Anaerolineaceae bacterium]